MPTGYDYTDYDENVDYKNLHLLWIAKHKDFRPRHPIISKFNTYLEQQKDLYDTQIKLNKTAYYYYKDDVAFFKERFDIDKKTKELFRFDNDCDDMVRYFVTINFPPDMEKFKKDKSKILTNLDKFLNSKMLIDGKAVFEYNGTNAHPHIMMLVTPNEYYKSWGRFKKQILQTALSKMVGENFTDIKTGKEYHDKYMNLEKKEDKKEALEKDVLWRRDNNLDEEYLRK